MKVLMKIVMVALVLFTANTVFATTGEPGFTVKDSGDKIINFYGSDVLAKEFEIKFQNKEGVILFSEYVIKPSTFERKYNLNELPNGNYSLLIVEQGKTWTLPIVINTNGLTVEYEKLVIFQYAALK